MWKKPHVSTGCERNFQPCFKWLQNESPAMCQMVAKGISFKEPLQKTGGIPPHPWRGPRCGTSPARPGRPPETPAGGGRSGRRWSRKWDMDPARCGPVSCLGLGKRSNNNNKNNTNNDIKRKSNNMWVCLKIGIAHLGGELNAQAERGAQKLTRAECTQHMETRRPPPWLYKRTPILLPPPMFETIGTVKE